ESFPWLVQLYDFHPVYQVLQIARGSLMNQGHYEVSYWIYFSAWSLLVFVGGLLFFWVAEERYGRD
ncbi:MAG: ABC transporter permease, partial [Micropruina sp.]|nr:ABC transporter permease [Micropruina sp.]